MNFPAVCFSSAKSPVGCTWKNEKQVRQLTEQQQFRIRLVFQSKEIEEHRYYLSEQRGFDVGLDQSATDWISRGQAKRFALNFSKKQEDIYAFCALHCDSKKCNVSCRLSMREIHNLMGD